MKKTLSVIAAAFILVSLPNFINNVSGINRSREGCERLNVSREAQYISIHGDAIFRQKEVNDFQKNLKLIKKLALGPAPVHDFILQNIQNKHFLNNDNKSLKTLLNSANDFTSSGKPKVKIDCVKAYPYPFPLN